MADPSVYVPLLEESLRLQLRRGRRTQSLKIHGGTFTPVNLHFLDVVSGRFDLAHPKLKRRELGPGEALVITPGTRYSICVQREPATIRYGHFDLLVGGALDLTPHLALPPLLPADLGKIIGDAIEDLNACRELDPEHPFGTLAKRKSAYARILSAFAACGSLTLAGRALVINAHRLMPALRYIQENLAQPISRADVAKAMNLSESRFSGLFSEIMGIGPVAFIRQTKLREAQILLQVEGLSVRETAHRLGFCDPFHFSKTYKKQFGVSPSQPHCGCHLA